MKKMFKRYLLAAFTLVLMLSMCACTVDPSDDGNLTKTIKVEMNIDYPDNDDYEFTVDGTMPEFPADIEDYRMKVEEGATVLQILESFASQNGLEILVDETDGLVYVTSIGGIAENENAVWIYEIEDKSTEAPASEYVPVNGDEITWEFIRL